jgi:NADH-quinone oxidoreductase subunit N
VVIGGVSLFATPFSSASGLIFGGMLRSDTAAHVFRLVFLLGAAITALLAADYAELNRRGEFYGLLVISALGMSLMASSADLIMIYLAVEMTSIPLYVLAGFMGRNEKSVEAGMKYLLYGAMTSAVMLFGFSLIFGFTGTTQIYTLAEKLQGGGLPLSVVLLPLALSLVGIGFKISAVPFHFWAPDVYEGAATPVAGYLSTASKAAGFALLLRFLTAAYPDFQVDWRIIIAVISTASMIVGNVLALTQKNMKRLLAYSSIAQAGYILIGVASNSPLGSTGAIYYLISYLVTNLAAFAIVSYVGKAVGSDDIAAFAGLSRKKPAIALAMLIALLSLGGIPPLAGFIGKLLVIGAAVQSGLTWLAIVGVLNSVVGLYYYLMVLRVIYQHPIDESLFFPETSSGWKVSMIVACAGILLLGTLAAPWYNLAVTAASAYF